MSWKGIAIITTFVLFALFAILVGTAAGGPIGGFVSALVLSVGAIILRPFRNRIEDIVNRNIDAPTQKCRILLIGLGRSGKTSIIRHILTEDLPRQEESTNNFDVYEEVKRLGLQSPQRHVVSIADYKGQKLSQITVNHPAKFFGRSGQRLVNAVVFVVDLFPELYSEQNIPLDINEIIEFYALDTQKKITRRVLDQLEYLNKYTIEQIFALAFSRENLFTVRLLVNKIDLLREIVSKGYLPIKEEHIEEYVRIIYTRVCGEIQKACQVNGINDFSIRLVSAKTGENIQPTLSDILETYDRRIKR